MSDETFAEADEAEAPNAPAGAPQEPAEADPAPSAEDRAPSAEDRALTMGWVPKEQFRGDPEKHVDAETFVKRGEEFLPFLKANNKRLERELEKANSKMDAMDRAIKRSVEHMSRADQRAYDRAKREIEADLDRAAEAGDVEGVRAANQDLVKLEKDTVAPAKDPNGWTPDFADAVETWKTANAWYGTDRAMTAFAHDIERDLVNDGVPDKQRLTKIAEAVRAEFPHKFTNPRRAAPAAVEGAGGGPRRPSGKSYADMPAEARQFCDELERDKITTRAKYVADFWKDAK